MQLLTKDQLINILAHIKAENQPYTGSLTQYQGRPFAKFSLSALITALVPEGDEQVCLLNSLRDLSQSNISKDELFIVSGEDGPALYMFGNALAAWNATLRPPHLPPLLSDIDPSGNEKTRVIPVVAAPQDDIGRASTVRVTPVPDLEGRLPTVRIQPVGERHNTEKMAPLPAPGSRRK